MDHLIFLSFKLHDSHIICVIESWLSKDISDDELSLATWLPVVSSRQRPSWWGGGGGGGQGG